MTELEQHRSVRVDASVIIATCNRASILEETLGHLRKQNLNGLTWEVIVVDNASRDNTKHVLRAAVQDLPVVALYEPTPGKNCALNTALIESRGELLIFTDDDVIPELNWVASYVAAAGRYTDCCIFGGPVHLRLPSSTPDWIRSYVLNAGPAHRGMYARFDPKIQAGPTAKELRPVGPNFAVRAASMTGIQYNTTIGPRGKDYAMGSETELLKRLISTGNQMAFVPAAIVEHVIPEESLTVDRLIERSFRMGRGQTRLRIIEGSLREMPFLFGSPRFMWRKLVEAYVQNITSLVLGRKSRLEAKAKLAKLRGAFYELETAEELS